MIAIDEKTTQKNPAKATVVNLGVSFLHLKDTEKTEKPIEAVRPNTNPIKDFSLVLPRAIISIPAVAMKIEIQTFKEIFSFKNKKANNAVKKGIAAKHSNVTAALVLVIEYIKVIIATPKPDPPMTPDKPCLLYTSPSPRD